MGQECRSDQKTNLALLRLAATGKCEVQKSLSGGFVTEVGHGTGMC